MSRTCQWGRTKHRPVLSWQRLFGTADIKTITSQISLVKKYTKRNQSGPLSSWSDTPPLLNPSETRQFYKRGQDHCLKVHKNRFHGQVQPFSPFWFFPPKTLPCKVGLYQFFSVISVIVWIRPPWFCIAQFPEWLVVPNSGAGTKRLYLGGTCPNYESTSQYRFRSWRKSSHIITFSF